MRPLVCNLNPDLRVDMKIYTPGPWQTMNSHKAGFQNVVSLGNDEPQNRKFICEIGPSDTTHLDAYLIASAPELLESCRAMVRAFETSKTSSYTLPNCEAINAAKAAIAKAEGTK